MCRKLARVGRVKSGMTTGSRGYFFLLKEKVHSYTV